MILTLTFAAWCFGHLGDIAAQLYGWLTTPWGYSARHRKGFREPSSMQQVLDRAREQFALSLQQRAELLLRLRQEAAVRAIRTATELPIPVSPPMYPAYDLPRRTLAPGWREDVEPEIPVAEMAGAR